MAFPLFKKSHDPSGQLSGPWTFRVLLDDGDSLTTATVVVVDAAGAPIVGTLLLVSNVSIGQVPGTQEVPGNIWGVSFYLQNGTPQFYNLRCRYTTTHSPTTGDDATMRLICEEG